MLESHDISSIEKINKLLDKNPEEVLIHITDTYFIEESSVNGIIDLPGFARFLSMIDNIRTNPTIKKIKPLYLFYMAVTFCIPQS